MTANLKDSCRWVGFLVILMAVLGASAVSAHAASFVNVYQTGFESPDFASGALAPQDGWSPVATVDSPATVSGVAANTGSQGVELEHGSGVGVQADANYFTNLSSETFVDVAKVTWDMNVLATGELTNPPFGPFFGMDNFTSSGVTKRVGFAGLDATTGEVLFSAPGTGLLSVDNDTVTLDAWHTWQMIMDFNTQTFDVTVDAVLVLDEIGFSDVTVDIANYSAAALTTFSGSNDTASNNQGGTAYYDNYSVMTAGVIVGDFNHDGIVNAEDIDLLRIAINTNSPDPIYDVNGGGLDGTDFTYEVQTIIGSAFGDADLNQQVTFTDFVSLSTNFGSSGTGWGQGNFNLDDITNFADFVAIANNWGIDLSSGVLTETPAPEPASSTLVFAGLALFGWRRRQ